MNFGIAYIIRYQQLRYFKIRKTEIVDRETLTIIFDNLPDGLLLLSPDKDRKVNTETLPEGLESSIKTGYVGWDHYTIDY